MFKVLHAPQIILGYPVRLLMRVFTSPRQGHRSPKLAKSTDSPGTASASSPKEYIVSRKSSLAPTDASTPIDVVHRTFSKFSDAAGEASSPTMSENLVSDAPTPHKKRKNDHIDVDNHESASDIDPMANNNKFAKEYLEMFMSHVNVPTFEIFPADRFIQWATNGQPKSMHENLMLYAMMAFGSIHSEKHRRKDHRARFKAAVYAGLHEIESRYCLETVHVLLFLAFTEFADGRDQKAFSIFVRCIGAIAALQLNIERSAHQSETAYGLSGATYAECCRRTYYAAACTDAFASIGKGDPRMMQDQDIFLRLPCTKDLYENDIIPVLPGFDPDCTIPKRISTPDQIAIGEIAWLYQIASICSEVQLNVWRYQNCLKLERPYTTDRDTREKLKAKLNWWHEGYHESRRLHENMNDRENTFHDRHHHNRSRSAVGLSLLFHYAHMELNKRVRHEDLSEREILEHAKEANIHAIEVLKLAQQVQEQGGLSTKDASVITRGVLTGYAVHTAIDIITAAGKTADILQPQSRIMSLMWSSSQLLEQLSTWWTSARVQHGLVKERIQLIWQKAQAAANEQKPYFYCSHPMVHLVDTGFDLIYGTNRKQYLKAAYGLLVVPGDFEILSINTKDKEAHLRLSN